MIKSIVQTCEDIVHVDSLSSPSSSTEQQPRQKKKGSSRRQTAPAKTVDLLTEVFASTKPYPSWWTEVEGSRTFQRRKSMGDAILERNICFVDTPGYSETKFEAEGMKVVLHYIEDQLSRSLSSASTSEGELVGLLCGNGGAQVDLVLYMISQGMQNVLELP